MKYLPESPLLFVRKLTRTLAIKKQQSLQYTRTFTKTEATMHQH